MKSNQSLRPFNTFGVDVSADLFGEFANIQELIDLLPEIRSHHTLISGGGSNILFTRNFSGLFLRNRIQGIQEISRSESEIILEAGAGENWHEFVLYCVRHGFGGIENLSLIPGCVGASPMQNIGAYGVEIKDVFEYLDALEISTGKVKRFNLNDCSFGYRESVFKRQYKNQFVILTVAFRLQLFPKVNTNYGVIENELKKSEIQNPTIEDVSNAIIAIRKSKLPDPQKLGNAGSFFKNPIVSNDLLNTIQNKFPDVPHYPSKIGTVKLAAGWLIEQSGWKGKRLGNCGVHDLQALVLVNYGSATGKEIFELSTMIIDDVKQKFGVELEREVNIY